MTNKPVEMRRNSRSLCLPSVNTNTIIASKQMPMPLNISTAIAFSVLIAHKDTR